MTYTADQRKRAEARQRALQRQAEKARDAVPRGFVLFPAEPRAVPLGCHTFEGLAELVGAPGMAGFVLAASCRIRCCVYGKSYPRFGSVRAWSVGAYRCAPGGRIEISAEGRGSGAVVTVKVFPFMSAAGYVAEPIREPELDANGLPDDASLPPPWEMAKDAPPARADAPQWEPAEADEGPPW